MREPTVVVNEPEQTQQSEPVEEPDIEAQLDSLLTQIEADYPVEQGLSDTSCAARCTRR